MTSSNWKIFLNEQIIEYKIYSINSIRVLLHLPEPQDYLSLIESKELELLNQFVLKSIREHYYSCGSDEDLTETSFNKHKTELFENFKIEGDNKNKLEKLYLMLREKYKSHTNHNSNVFAYDDAIINARNRIWVCQTWLPSTEKDALKITKRDIADTRLLLLSFKIDPDGKPPLNLPTYSPIYARLSGRGLTIEDGQLYSARSVKALANKCLNQNIDVNNIIRFNYGHYPCWIAIIDDFAFCGFTPVDLESHSEDFLFHKYYINSHEGKFWKGQFELMWNKYSHSFDEEKNYNTKLIFN